jgi:sodium-coupled neutral amino acid transporter 9
MGSSLLTMPWGMQNSGLLMGIITIVIMGGLCLYTTHKILQVQMQHGKSDFKILSFMSILGERQQKSNRKLLPVECSLGGNY